MAKLDPATLTPTADLKLEQLLRDRRSPANVCEQVAENLGRHRRVLRRRVPLCLLEVTRSRQRLPPTGARRALLVDVRPVILCVAGRLRPCRPRRRRGRRVGATAGLLLALGASNDCDRLLARRGAAPHCRCADSRRWRRDRARSPARSSVRTRSETRHVRSAVLPERNLPAMWPRRRAARESLPRYLELARSGEVERRAAEAHELLGERCVVCPRGCKTDRRADVKGLCAIGRYAVVASYFPHFGEENCLRAGEAPERSSSAAAISAACSVRTTTSLGRCAANR